MIKLYCKAELYCITCNREETVDIELRSTFEVEPSMSIVKRDPPGWHIFDGSSSCSDRDACYKRAGYT